MNTHARARSFANAFGVLMVMIGCVGGVFAVSNAPDQQIAQNVPPYTPPPAIAPYPSPVPGAPYPASPATPRADTPDPSRANAPASVPQTLVQAGSCQVFVATALATTRKYEWRGPCIGGVAQGPGLLFVSDMDGANKGVIQGTRQDGRAVGAFTSYFSREGRFERVTGDGQSAPNAVPISVGDLPDWARGIALQ